MAKLRVCLLYGGRSTEHEVSIITALQVMHSLDKEKYDFTPTYVTKSGQWILGNEQFALPEVYANLDEVVQMGARLIFSPDPTQKASRSLFGISSLLVSLALEKFDVAMPLFHGPNGEDGTIQGFLELADIPYTFSGVAGSAAGMDKVVQKLPFAGVSLPQTRFGWFTASEWKRDKKTALGKIKSLKYPLFVKPANGGSSIGVTQAKSPRALSEAVEVAVHYDRKVLVEEGLVDARDINISILGNSGGELKFSVCEEPIKSARLLSYEDKYVSGGGKSEGMASAKRVVPAKINRKTKERIVEVAGKAYATLGLDGLARLDFLVSGDEKIVYINEVNTIPGSLAYYLWDKSGIKFSELLDRLIQLALKRHQEKGKVTYIFKTNILANLGETMKGGKPGGKV